MSAIVTFTADTQLERTHIKDQSIYLVDCTAGNVVITLPELEDNRKDGTTFGFMKVDSTGNTVKVVAPGSEFLQNGSTDYRKMLGDSPYYYHQFIIIDGLYKELLGDWTPTNA